MTTGPAKISSNQLLLPLVHDGVAQDVVQRAGHLEVNEGLGLGDIGYAADNVLEPTAVRQLVWHVNDRRVGAGSILHAVREVENRDLLGAPQIDDLSRGVGTVHEP